MLINWAAFLKYMKSNKRLFSGNKGDQHNNEKEVTLASQKIYLRSKIPYFSQIPVILNLFNLKTKVKLMVKNKNR